MLVSIWIFAFLTIILPLDQDLPSSHLLPSTDAQRLMNMRRVEPTHSSSGLGAKPSMITCFEILKF